MRSRMTLEIFSAALVMIGLARLSVAADAPTTAPSNYPLTVCLISGEKLGAMGAPDIIQFEGREVRFCCSNCEKEFRENPKKYLSKLDDAAKAAAAAPATQPVK